MKSRGSIGRSSRVFSMTSAGSTEIERREISQLLENKARLMQMVKMMTVLVVPIIALLGMSLAGLTDSISIFEDSTYTVQIIEDSLQVCKPTLSRMLVESTTT